MNDLVKILMTRDGLTEAEARAQVAEARDVLMERLANDESPFDLMDELFGLEPDYLECLI